MPSGGPHGIEDVVSAADDTTGMPNRRAFLTRLHAAHRAGHPVGVVLVDLDTFKTVNDTFGHDTGNEVLTEVGRRLTALAYPVTLAARLSGDEFVLLVAGDTSAVDAAAREAWRAVARHPFDVAGCLLSVRASVGHATARPDFSPERTMRCADEAMYVAKVTGFGVYGATKLSRRRRLAPAHRCQLVSAPALAHVASTGAHPRPGDQPDSPDRRAARVHRQRRHGIRGLAACSRTQGCLTRPPWHRLARPS